MTMIIGGSQRWSNKSPLLNRGKDTGRNKWDNEKSMNSTKGASIERRKCRKLGRSSKGINSKNWRKSFKFSTISKTIKRRTVITSRKDRYSVYPRRLFSNWPIITAPVQRQSTTFTDNGDLTQLSPKRWPASTEFSQWGAVKSPQSRFLPVNAPKSVFKHLLDWYRRTLFWVSSKCVHFWSSPSNTGRR